MENMTIFELIEVLGDVEDKSQEVRVWVKSIANYRKIKLIYENDCGGLDVVVE